MIPFIKAHACGNDFLIVKEQYAGGRAHDELTRSLCNRNQGVGADGVEFFAAEAARKGTIHLYNADGSMAEISGNGTRCVAAWMAYETKAAPGDDLYLKTDAGPRACRVVSREGGFFLIASSMGVPEIQRRAVVVGGERVDGAVVSTGNPHFVIFVDSPDFEVCGRTWQSIGEEISTHADFPHQTNVEFVRRLSSGEIEIRIYERGVGPTTSSGTGTCAAASASIALRGAEKALHVTAPGGTQFFHWDGGRSEMLLTGPAELVCFGEAF
ncbi:MAG TPA: diaminopimelate epimerase [Acidobacteriaceae bacterium]|jgi:diaminopimelate epimerase|nr:diaminopimelate epimerase [Acidobacteriaceae bacterium]